MMSTSAPRVTFLLPVHNHAKTVTATVDSILAQTLQDFELVIIDDASTDGTEEILRGLRDPRIGLHRNASNLELARTLNLGLSMARGEFVARIDADDLCLPQRAERQVAFLEAHPDVAVVGAYVQTISDGGLPLEIIRYPTDRTAVAAAFVFRNPLAHPAVMLRHKLLAQKNLWYDEAIRRGQDYDLWVRCVLARVPMANVPEVLLQYRVHERQASRRDAGGVRETGALVRRKLLQGLGLTASDAESALHEQLSWDELQPVPEWLTAASAWLESIARANASARLFDHDALGRVLCGRWVRVLQFARRIGMPLNITGSPLAPYLDPQALT